MTIQEVIKSGLPFRRSGCTKWYGACEDKQGLYLDAYLRSGSERTHLAWSLKAGDLLATDWEIKSEPMIVYINVYSDGGLGNGYMTANAAILGRGHADCVTRKFVEVIE